MRFETLMNQRDWITAIEMLVPNIHLPDEALLRLLRKCVPDNSSHPWRKAQALLLRDSVIPSRWQPAEYMCTVAH